MKKLAPAYASLRRPRCGCCPTSRTPSRESTRLGSEISLEDEPFWPRLSPDNGDGGNDDGDMDKGIWDKPRAKESVRLGVCSTVFEHFFCLQ